VTTSWAWASVFGKIGAVSFKPDDDLPAVRRVLLQGINYLFILLMDSLPFYSRLYCLRRIRALLLVKRGVLRKESVEWVGIESKDGLRIEMQAAMRSLHQPTL
jgi:hypothetical protein